MTAAPLYDDGRIRCDEEGLRIAWYYPWGSRRLAYSTIRSVTRRELSPVRGKWRIWGSGDFKHWYNLDPTRPDKTVGFELHVGGHIVPVITPDDPDELGRLLRARTGGAKQRADSPADRLQRRGRHDRPPLVESPAPPKGG
jgi:hypothetical protein